MTFITFSVENDFGKMVEKKETSEWVRDSIYADLTSQGYKNTFYIRQKDSSSIEAYDRSGRSIIYHYGGFDGFEVLEPVSFKNWN